MIWPLAGRGGDLQVGDGRPLGVTSVGMESSEVIGNKIPER